MSKRKQQTLIGGGGTLYLHQAQNHAGEPIHHGGKNCAAFLL